MSDNPGTLLEAVQTVARLAGEQAMSYFRSPLTIEAKRDGSPVTVADRSAETAARDWIMKHFPRDGILGEELGEHLPDAQRRWVLDPIDGTKTFVRGVPLWGSLVAVCEGPTVIAGAAAFPAVGELLAAAVGEGCWWNGVRANVSDVARLEQATVLTTDERFQDQPLRGERWRQVATGAAVSRSWGDCYGYLLVATGRAEVMVDPVLSVWDTAALMPIITEAGGVFTDWTGTPTCFGGEAIATNAALADTVRQMLGVPTPR